MSTKHYFVEQTDDGRYAVPGAGIGARQRYP
jgi:hypothetical protein